MMTLSENLYQLRKQHNLTQEQIANELGVSRQAFAKWENGETTPDLNNCLALADFFQVSLDDLVHYDHAQTGLPFPPQGKYYFGTVIVDKNGQITLPQQAQDLFHLHPGTSVALLGDQDRGLAILNADFIKALLEQLNDSPLE